MVLLYNELSRNTITVLCKSREGSLWYQELSNISLNRFIDGNMLEVGESLPQHLHLRVLVWTGVASVVGPQQSHVNTFMLFYHKLFCHFSSMVWTGKHADF